MSRIYDTMIAKSDIKKDKNIVSSDPGINGVSSNESSSRQIIHQLTGKSVT